MSTDTKAPSFIVRSWKPEDDRNFVLATWLRGLFYGDSWFALIPKAVFMENYHRLLEHRLSDPSIKVSIACLTDDPDVILGYSVYRIIDNVTVLDWVFVKSAWRKAGVAKSLIPQNLQACTHLTKLGKMLKPEHVIFNPFI